MNIHYPCQSCGAEFPFYWQWVTHVAAPDGCETARIKAEFDEMTKDLTL
jgi:hypothetical protein